MMYWLLLKVIPLGFIVRVLALAMLVTAAVAGLMAYGALADTSVCEGAEDYQTCLAEETTKDDVLDIINSSPSEASQAEVDAVNAAVDSDEIDLSDEDTERINDWLAEEQDTTTDSGDSGDTADGPADDPEATDESTLFYHGGGVRLHSVTANDDGEAVVKVSSVSGGEEVVITDSSRQTEGEMVRYRYDLKEGMNTFRVPLHNPETPAITVDTAGRMYLWIGETSNINWAPDAGHSLGMTIGGGAVVLVMMTGLQLLLERGATKPKNPIK